MLASLWPVESQSAKSLIIGFFEAWRSQKDLSASRAFALATRQFLATADDVHQHPSMWAPFLLIGNGQVTRPGSTIPPSQPSSSLQPLQGFASGGEIMDAAIVARDLALTMIGEWDGKKMNSIISRRTLSGEEKWRVSSREVGAGGIAARGVHIYIAGYTTEADPLPSLRAFDSLGSPLWDIQFPSLRGYMLSNPVALETGVAAVAFPHTSTEGPLYLVYVSKSGISQRY